MSTLDNLRKDAKRWLKALRGHEPSAIARLRAAWSDAPGTPGLRDVQHALARERGHQSWTALTAAAAAGSAAAGSPSPTLARYEELAGDLVVAFETGDPEAMRRLMDHYGGSVTWEQLREGVTYDLSTLPWALQPEGDFALPHARLVVARQAGFDDWPALERLLRDPREAPSVRDPLEAPAAPDLSPGMILPVEMKAGFRMKLSDGTYSTTTEVWNMLTACRNGELGRVRTLVEARPSLVSCDYNYMPPLHLAVRENRIDIVRYLCERGAANPNYRTYPYRETLLTIAMDRGYDEIAEILQQHYAEADRFATATGARR